MEYKEADVADAVETDNTLNFTVRSRQDTGLVDPSEVAAVFQAVSDLYLITRAFQYIWPSDDPEKRRQWPEESIISLFDLDFELRHPDVMNWIGRLGIESVSLGSLTVFLKALGEGLGTGVAKALEGAASALEKIALIPGLVWEQWKKHALLGIDELVRIAELEALKLHLDWETWAIRVLKGEIDVQPFQRIVAIKVCMKAGSLPSDGDELIARIGGSVERLSFIAEPGRLAA